MLVLKQSRQQYEKRHIQAPVTAFSNFSDEVLIEGGKGKLPWPWHTHGRAPRSSYQPRQIMCQWENSQLWQHYEMPYRNKTEIVMVPVVEYVIGIVHAFWVLQHR